MLPKDKPEPVPAEEKPEPVLVEVKPEPERVPGMARNDAEEWDFLRRNAGRWNFMVVKISAAPTHNFSATFLDKEAFSFRTLYSEKSVLLSLHRKSFCTGKYYAQSFRCRKHFPSSEL